MIIIESFQKHKLQYLSIVKKMYNQFYLNFIIHIKLSGFLTFDFVRLAVVSEPEVDNRTQLREKRVQWVDRGGQSYLEICFVLNYVHLFLKLSARMPDVMT